MLIEVKNLSKNYGTGNSMVKALENVSFTISKGDFAAVCGKSGSGKSTLISIIAGLSRPTEGEVITDDISIYKQLNSDGLARFRSEYIGFVFQSFHLLPYLSTLQNVMLPLAHKKIPVKEKKRMALDALEKVGIPGKSKKLPGQLSGGECQRAAIARAIVNHPLLLLADEPTGNLDTANRDEIIKLFAELPGRGQTIIMVTHDPDNIKKSNKIISLEDGRITA